MKTHIKSWCMGAVLLAAPSLAHAGIIPTVPTCTAPEFDIPPSVVAIPRPDGLLALLTIGQQTIDLSGGFCFDGKMFHLNYNNPSLNGSDVTINTTINPDPFIDFGFSIRNNTAVNQVFTLQFNGPITPGTYTSSRLDFSSTVTNANGGTMTLGSNPFYLTGSGNLGSVPLGAIGTAPCVATPVNPSNNCGYGPQSFAINSALTTLRADVSFTLTPGTRATGSGIVEVFATVPEPASVVLMFTGLVAIGGIARRRRQG